MQQKAYTVNRLPLITLFGANIISLTGSVMTIIAVPWFVLQTTGSPARTGLTAFFEILATVIAGFLGGTIVDRVGYKRMSVGADIASGAAVGLVPLLYYTVGLAFWQLLALVFLSAFFNAPGETARTALLPDVAELAGVRLERVNSATQAITRGSRLVGAPLAGLLIALIGTSRVLWIDAASFGISAVMIATAIPKPQGRASSVEAPKRYFSELLDGMKFIFQDRVIFAIVLTVMITNFLDSPLSTVIMPVYVKERFGNALDLGLFIAAFGGGSLVGAIIFGMIGHKLPRRATFALSFIIAGLPFWVLAMLPSLPITIAVAAIGGVASGPLNPIIDTVTQERVPNDMRGRVFGTITAGAWLCMPLGVLLAGYLLELIGLHLLLLIIATCYLVTTMSLLINRGLREMNTPGSVRTTHGSEAA